MARASLAWLLVVGCTLAGTACGSPEPNGETGAAEQEASVDSTEDDAGQEPATELSGAPEPPVPGVVTTQTSVRPLRCEPRNGARGMSQPVAGGNRGWIYFNGHKLDIAAGTVPVGQTITFTLREDPANMANLVGERTAGSLGTPYDGGPRFTLRISYAPCEQDPANPSMILRIGGPAHGGRVSQARSWVEADLDQFGSTYAAATPAVEDFVADTASGDTVPMDTTP